MRGGAQGRQAVLLLAVLVVVTGLGVVAYATTVFNGLELSTINQRFSVRGPQEPPDDLVVVQIDDVTFDETGLQWPFPRSVHAEVIDRISADAPKSITYDVQFSERSAPKLLQLAPQTARVLGLSRRQARRSLKEIGNADDIALAEAILNSDRKMVLSFTETNAKGQVNFLDGGPEFLREVEGRPGNGLYRTDRGGVIRRVVYDLSRLKSLPVASVEVATAKPVDRGRFPENGAWIDYYGGPGTLRTVSFSDVVQNKLPKGFFRNKLVVVGPSAPVLQDVHPTSTTAG
ncbi:MAG: CHASE2 domain-containing protein, partial [Solirubrobacteraceae bacterium]